MLLLDSTGCIYENRRASEFDNLVRCLWQCIFKVSINAYFTANARQNQKNLVIEEQQFLRNWLLLLCTSQYNYLFPDKKVERLTHGLLKVLS